MIETKNISKQSGIYKFTNKINNKVYIGQASKLRSRVRDHINFVKNNKRNSYFYSSIKKYGLENFELEILIEGKFTKNELNQIEIRFIELFKSNNQLFGYNLTEGGGGTKNFKCSQETKDKISKANKGKKPSVETRKKLSESHKGFKHTEESKQKMIETKRKNGTLNCKHSEETKKKMSKIKKGKIVSEETREKLSKSGKGKKRKQETKDKISQNNRVRFISQEMKDKIRNSQKGRKHSKLHIEKATKGRMLNKARKLIEENCCYEEYFYGDFKYKS